MKIQCDVCDKDEASVFCIADEAAICAACDHRVHHANKLASKHHRFSLLQPSTNQSPLCDVCQERRAFLFCRQDRAMICRDCDVLTGIKLSTTSDFYEQSKPDLINGDYGSFVPDLKSKPMIKKPRLNPKSVSKSSSFGEENWRGSEGGELGSSISEYLIETLPGWHVKDLMDSSPHDFSKVCCKEIENSLNVFKEWEESNMKIKREGWIDDGFTVPQISQSSSGFKRSRPFC